MPRPLEEARKPGSQASPRIVERSQWLVEPDIAWSSGPSDRLPGL